MRNYIERNIKTPAAEYVKAVYEEAIKAFNEESFTANSVSGSISNRACAKNCFIMGEVITKGDCKMHECVVARNAKVILEEGAVVSRCMFGGTPENAQVKVEIHVGKNCIISDSLIDLSTKIGDNSGIIISSIHTKCLNSYGDKAPTLTLGKNVLLANALIQLHTPNKEKEPTDCSYTIGNRCVVLHCHLDVRDITLQTGDDNMFGPYSDLLKACTQGIAEVIKTATLHPANSRAADPCGGALGAQHPGMKYDVPTTIGNRCVLASSLCFARVPTDTGRCGIVMDDEVVVAFTGRVPADHYVDMFADGIITRTPQVTFGEGSTILVKGLDGDGNGATYTSLEVGEYSTVTWDNRRDDHREAMPMAVKVAPYSLIQI